jgi:hypothetical protein
MRFKVTGFYGNSRSSKDSSIRMPLNLSSMLYEVCENGAYLAAVHDFSLGAIDYRCEDGRFSVSTSCVPISDPESLSSSETGVNSGKRS